MKAILQNISRPQAQTSQGHKQQGKTKKLTDWREF